MVLYVGMGGGLEALQFAYFSRRVLYHYAIDLALSGRRLLLNSRS
jgi:hypothetical protein